MPVLSDEEYFSDENDDLTDAQMDAICHSVAPDRSNAIPYRPYQQHQPDDDCLSDVMYDDDQVEAFL